MQLTKPKLLITMQLLTSKSDKKKGVLKELACQNDNICGANYFKTKFIFKLSLFSEYKFTITLL